MDLIEKYNQGTKTGVQVGQKCKRIYEEDGVSYYQSGVVIAVYDTHFQIMTKNGPMLFQFNEPKEMREIHLMTIDGEPAIAKKNIFGRYKIDV